MSNVEQFVPDAVELGSDKATMEEIAAVLAPARDFTTDWLAFLAMKRRVESPRRRGGGDVSRAGPVLLQFPSDVRGS